MKVKKLSLHLTKKSFTAFCNHLTTTSFTDCRNGLNISKLSSQKRETLNSISGLWDWHGLTMVGGIDMLLRWWVANPISNVS